MLTIHQLQAHFAYLPSHLLDIMVELRNLVAAAAPDAVEEVRSQGLVYYAAERGGPVSAGICQILIKPDHIRLAFIHGAFLPDPHGLLQGDTDPKRFVPVYHYDEAPWEDLQALIDAHRRFDPYTQTFLPPGEKLELAMEPILTRCGYRCDLCLAYRPNVAAHPEYQQTLSDGWFAYFGFRIPPEEIMCDGCMADDPLLIDKGCPVRPCVMERGLANCAGCGDYICEKLKERVVIRAEVRERIGRDIPTADYERFIRPYENLPRLLALRIGKEADDDPVEED